MLTNEYLKRVYEGLEKRNANEPEFLQAVREVLESIQPVVEKHPEYEKAGLIERLVEPEHLSTSIFLGRIKLSTIAIINTTATQFSANTVLTICGKILKISGTCVNPSPTLRDKATIVMFL